MKMNYNIVHILLHNFLEEDRKLQIYQTFEADFRKILTLSTPVIRPMNDLAKLRIQRVITANNMGINPASVSLYFGVIAPIYYTAVKCRNLAICRDAVSLLTEAPWREGAWDSLVMANIAEKQIRRHLEEGYYEADVSTTLAFGNNPSHHVELPRRK